MTNEQFFEKYSGSACVGLVGGTHFIDRAIKNAQKKLTVNRKSSHFSHAFILSEKRSDGKWWLIESDLEFHRKQVRLGVQENRVDKYFDSSLFPNVAILDFKLTASQQQDILTEALNLVAGRGKYSLRETLGVLLSFSKEKRDNENLFAQENSFICSSLVQHCYHRAEIIFNETVSLKHITPEDIYATRKEHSVNKIIRQE